MRSATCRSVRSTMQLPTAALIAGAVAAWGCKAKEKEIEPSPPTPLLGQFSPRTSEHVSKTCKGALAWSGTKSVTCVVEDKPLRYYTLDFADSGLVTMISFGGIDDAAVEELLDRVIAPLADPSVVPTLRASIRTSNHTTEPVAGIPFLATARDDWDTKGARRPLLMWMYSPPPARESK